MIRTALLLIVSYISAAPFTSRISLNLADTEWLHIATYVWWAGSLTVWVLISFLSAIALVVLNKR